MKKSYTRYDAEGGNLTAKYLLEIGAVEFRPEYPFQFTSGRLSPIYVDVRRICGIPHARNDIIAMACSKIYSRVKVGSFQVVAGGETAGIPIAAFIADRMNRPMAYVRKMPKSFGRGAQIEGLSENDLALGRRFLLCEDLMSEGGSKHNFVEAIRRSSNIVTHCFVIYSYGCFGAEERLLNDGIELVSLCDAQLLTDVAEDLGIYSPEIVAGVREFLAEPDAYWDAHKTTAASHTAANGDDTAVAPKTFDGGRAETAAHEAISPSGAAAAG